MISPIVNSATGTALLPVVRATLIPSSFAASDVDVVDADAPLVQQLQPACRAQHIAADTDLTRDRKVGIADDLLQMLVAARRAVRQYKVRRQEVPQMLGPLRGGEIEQHDGVRHSANLSVSTGLYCFESDAGPGKPARDADGRAVGTPAGGAGHGAIAGKRDGVHAAGDVLHPLDRVAALPERFGRRVGIRRLQLERSRLQSRCAAPRPPPARPCGDRSS